MTNLILFDDESWQHLLPLSYTRPVAEIFVGGLTMREKWQHTLGGNTSWLTQDYLEVKFPLYVSDDNLLVNAAVLPNPQLAVLIRGLEMQEAIVDNDDLIATRVDAGALQALMEGKFNEEISGLMLQETTYKKIDRPWKIFQLLDEEIRNDFELLTKGRKSASASQTNTILNPADLFIERNVKMEACIINAEEGPVYIGESSHIMEGAILKGPLVLSPHSTVKMGAKIYGPSSFGPHCKIGGEVQNCAFFGYANKAHDGYLGNSVIGEWCNLGADTNNSNLKNNYSEVRLWNYPTEQFAHTGTQFCGLIMGDHAKCGINTMFNTGTVVGVSANLYGPGYHRNFVPSFSWGEPKSLKTYRLSKALEVAKVVMARRDIELSAEDETILTTVFEDSAKFRSWEKAD